MANRYSGPVYLRLVGDKLAASKLVGRARTLLGALLNVITPHGATSGSREYRYATGERIRVLTAGAIKVVEIFCPPLAEAIRRLLFRGFVCTVSYDDPLPTAIGAYPQVVLVPDEKDDWGVWFYSSEFFYSQSTAERKATYGQEYLNGLKHAGQIDWRSEEGIHISWHGPANRYWWSPAQTAFLGWNLISPVYFGRKVYCAGNVLLDVDAYDTANATSLAGFVMGAGLLRLGAGSYHLFVILRAQFVSDNDTLHRVVRYDCVVDQNIVDDLCKLRVVNGTGQLLFSFNSQFSKSPWFFNESCTEAVHMSDDRTFSGGQYRESWYANYDFVDGSPGTLYPPPASNRIVTLSLISSSITSQTVSVPVADFDDPGSAPYIPERFPVAVDFRRNTLVTAYIRYEQQGNGPSIIDAYLDIEDASYHLGRVDDTQEPARIFYNPTAFFRQLRYADLRDNFIVTFSEYTTFAEPSEVDGLYVFGSVDRYEELWSRGSLAWRQLVFQRPQSTGLSGGELYTHAMYIPQYCNAFGVSSQNITFATMSPRAFMNAGWNTAGFYASIASVGGVSARRRLTTGFLYDACPIDIPANPPDPAYPRFTTYALSQTVEDEDNSRWFMAAGKFDNKFFVSLPEGGTNGFPPSHVTGGSAVRLTGTYSVDDARFYPMFILDKLPE